MDGIKTKNTVRFVLENNPEARDSDRKLIWEVWKLQGYIINNTISYDNFISATSGDTITRFSRKIKEKTINKENPKFTFNPETQMYEVR